MKHPSPLVSLSLLFFPIVSLCAAPPALIYENEPAVLASKYILGTPAADGYLIPSNIALSAGSNLLIGPVGGKLSKGVLVRLDNDLSLAFVRAGDVVGSEQVQKAFQTKSDAISKFLPVAAVPDASQAEIQRAESANEPFLIKIDGQDVGASTVTLKSKLKKSKFRLEVVSLSTAAIWNIHIELTSNPKLAFWPEGKVKGLNEVPTQKFVNDHQLMFKSMKAGDTHKVKVEVYFINETDYDWTFRIKTKTQSMEKVAHIQFN